MAEGYWIIDFKVFAFDTREEANTFSQKLIDAFCAMPETVGIGASADIKFESEGAGNGKVAD